MGSAPISFSEIAAWQQLTGISLSSWESRTLRRLSGEYSREMHLAENPNRLSPFIEIKNEGKGETANKVRSILRG